MVLHIVTKHFFVNVSLKNVSLDLLVRYNFVNKYILNMLSQFMSMFVSFKKSSTRSFLEREREREREREADRDRDS